MAIDQELEPLTSIVTRGYAPFEQYGMVDSELRQGPWSGVYGLAATLHHIITGAPPSDALTRGTAILEGIADNYQPAKPNQGCDYSARLLGAIDRGLAFKADERPQTIAQWRAMFPAAPPAGARIGDTLRVNLNDDGAQVTDTVRESALPTTLGEVGSDLGPLVVPAVPAADLSGLSILVVDDESFVRNLAKRVLINLGVKEVAQAQDGHEALAMLESDLVNVIDHGSQYAGYGRR